MAQINHQEVAHALISNDAVVFGILMVMLGFVFWSSSHSHPLWKNLYRFFPALLMCYFLPSLLTLLGIVDPEESQLYFVASRYLLPASLVLMTLSIDLRSVLRLGPKAVIMFLTASFGVVFGGPLAILLMHWFGYDFSTAEESEALWRGFSTVAGSWIGGGANQTAMKEIFQPSDQLYSAMVAVDIVVAEIWMMFLLLGVERRKWINEKLSADDSSIQVLQEKMDSFAEQNKRIPSVNDLFFLLAIAFGSTAASHFVADRLAPWIGLHSPKLRFLSLDSSFFWLITIATTLGLLFSFTKIRNLEGAGASKMGTVCIYILVATIGLKMDLAAVLKFPSYFLIGGIWMAFHVLVLFAVAKLIRAPYFFLAVGSKANIGGAASAPVVAAAFHPSLAPVGVLLAVLGYALGTYGAWLSTILMRWVSL